MRRDSSDRRVALYTPTGILRRPGEGRSLAANWLPVKKTVIDIAALLGEHLVESEEDKKGVM
jgi:hypothetical protein